MKTYVRPITLMRCIPFLYTTPSLVIDFVLNSIELLRKEFIHIKVFGPRYDSIYFVDSYLNMYNINEFDK